MSGENYLPVPLSKVAFLVAILDLHLDAHYNWYKCDTLTGPNLGYSVTGQGGSS